MYLSVLYVLAIILEVGGRRAVGDVQIFDVIRIDEYGCWVSGVGWEVEKKSEKQKEMS